MCKNHLFIPLLLIVAAVLGCSMFKDSKAAGPAVEKFHQQFNDEQFKQIYAESGERMKAAATEAELTELLSAIHEKLGDIRESKQTSWHVNSNPTASEVTLVYDTAFAKGKGTETFIITVIGDKALIEGYNINSKELILK